MGKLTFFRDRNGFVGLCGRCSVELVTGEVVVSVRNNGKSRWFHVNCFQDSAGEPIFDDDDVALFKLFRKVVV